MMRRKTKDSKLPDSHSRSISVAEKINSTRTELMKAKPNG
jgi:hypothetical protein